MAIFIEWTDEEGEFIGWRYAGNGINEPMLKRKPVVRRVRYSNTVNDEMMRRAADYVSTDRPEAKVVVIDA